VVWNCVVGGFTLVVTALVVREPLRRVQGVLFLREHLNP